MSDAGKPMKAADVKPCSLCGKGLAHTGLPIFYRVKVEAMGLDARAIEQTAGLEMMVGNVAIARALGPDPDIAKMINSTEGLLCQACAVGPDALMLLMEKS